MKNLGQKLQKIIEGEIVILTDSEKRENEADLFFPASLVNYQKVNFMLQNSAGMICIPMSIELSQRLNLPPMIDQVEEHYGCNMTVSCDAKKGISTGVSAKDKAKTIQVLSNPESLESDLVRPGHVFPIIGASGGIRERGGHTEMSLEICKRLNLPLVGVIAELINSKGEVLRKEELQDFSTQHFLEIINIKELI